MNQLNEFELTEIYSDEECETPISGLINTPQSHNFMVQHSALPSFARQCKFEWKNLDVYIGNEDGKQILYNFNGSIESGELLAVMGGSGAGKSTFLNALSGRTDLNQQTVNGYLAINHKKFVCSDQKTIKSICTYVPQSDELCETQTVQEALTFYAKLKLPHYSAEKQEKRINYLIDVLHLNKCRNNYIGSQSKRGISGGEKRRVSIASEILNDKDIIFLDEPTSGLDAYTAARTIKTLKQFCMVSNKIVIATIHQPSIEVFYLFDKLILLSNGKCCFNSYIKDIDRLFKNKLKPKTNPADVIVFQVQKHCNSYAQKWETSELNAFKVDDDKWNNYDEFDLNNPKNSIRTFHKSAPKMLQCGLLLKREIRGLIRNKRLTIIRIAQVVFFALATGFCYMKIAEPFTELAQAFFLLTIMPLLFGIVCLLTSFPAQKLLFEREYNSKTYGITQWALSFMIIEIPREVIHMFIFTVIIYFMIDKLDGNIFEYWFNFFLTSIAGGSFGIFFGTITKTTVEATQLVPAALIPLLIFSDGLIPLSNLPHFLKWIGVVNPLYFLIRCFYIIEFYGAVYTRQLSDDEKQLCYSKNMTSSNRILLDNTTDIGHIFNISNDQSINNTDWNQSIFEFNFNSTNMVIIPTQFYDSITTTVNDLNITTTVNEAPPSLERICNNEISWEDFFSIKELDENALLRYWMTILLICFILRVVSVLILLAMNNNVFSCIYNRIRMIMTCRWCKTQNIEEINGGHDKLHNETVVV